MAWVDYLGLTLLVALLSYYVFGLGSSVATVFPSRKLHDHLPDYLVLDVREASERVASGFVPTSIHVSLGHILKYEASGGASRATTTGSTTSRTTTGPDTSSSHSTNCNANHDAIESNTQNRNSKHNANAGDDGLGNTGGKGSSFGNVNTNTNININSIIISVLENHPHDQPILVVCQSGTRSMAAARALARLGFTQVFNLSLGTIGWKAWGLPLQYVEHVQQHT